MPYRSTKTYGHEIGLSCAFRQWKAESHCRFLHGYALSVKLTFEADELDATNWVMDFGGLKEVKVMLQEQFDHKTVVAFDDPIRSDLARLHDKGALDLVIVSKVGCEAFAELIFRGITSWMQAAGHSPRVHLIEVEVREHGANSAIYRREA